MGAVRDEAFIAAVVGGIGSVPGAMVGGYLIGMTEVMISAFGNSMIRDAVVYLNFNRHFACSTNRNLRQI